MNKKRIKQLLRMYDQGCFSKVPGFHDVCTTAILGTHYLIKKGNIMYYSVLYEHYMIVKGGAKITTARFEFQADNDDEAKEIIIERKARTISMSKIHWYTLSVGNRERVDGPVVWLNRVKS